MAVATARRWADPEVTWSFATTDYGRDASWRFSDVMDEAFAVLLVQQALAEWAAASGLHFTQVADAPNLAGAAEMRIGWASFGADEPTIGLTVSRHDRQMRLQPGVLVQIEDPAERPLEAEPDGTLVYDGTAGSVYAVILHEIGHALGLGHLSDPDALMFYAAGRGNRDLSGEDVAAIRALYPELAPDPAAATEPGSEAVAAPPDVSPAAPPPASGPAASPETPPVPAQPAPAPAPVPAPVPVPAPLPAPAPAPEIVAAPPPEPVPVPPAAPLPPADAARFAFAGRRAATFAATADGDGAVFLGGEGFAVPAGGVLDFADGRVVFDGSDPAARVVRLYAAALDRAPDQGGLNHHAGRLMAGAGLDAVAADLLRSPEFDARFGAGLADAAFVERLYGNVLGRVPVAAEADYHLAQLGSGRSRAATLVDFSESPENQALTADAVRAGIWDLSENAAAVARLYDALLGRRPDVAGLLYARSRLDDGSAMLSDLAREFALSPEFRARNGGDADDADYVALLYRNALGRAGEAGEVAYHVALLEGGLLDHVAVALNFSESPEHVALTLPAVMSENQPGIAFA